MKMVKGSWACYFLLLFLVSAVWGQYSEQIEDFTAQNETSFKYYNSGVDKGIINPQKYPYESFLRDEQNVFKDFYQEYTSFNETEPINYEDWLIMNNYGLLSDTQESLFDKKITKRSVADNKRRFVNAVRKGDILITGRGIGGLVGHAAIMTTNNYVLEMRGGKGWEKGIKSNNRQVTKHKWFDEHQNDWTIVYRVPKANAANMAANWADRTYYNPSGGAKKTKHITYLITIDVWKTNPSYCSKLVVQAYYFGTGSMKVIDPNAMRVKRVIVPTQIPSYFRSNFRLKKIGKY